MYSRSFWSRICFRPARKSKCRAGFGPGHVRRKERAADWHNHLRLYHDHFDKLTFAMKEAIEHILVTLQLKQQASETQNFPTGTGTPGFLIWYDTHVQEFYTLQKSLIQLWNQRNKDASMGQEQDPDSSACAPAPLALIYVGLDQFCPRVKLMAFTDFLSSGFHRS